MCFAFLQNPGRIRWAGALDRVPYIRHPIFTVHPAPQVSGVPPHAWRAGSGRCGESDAVNTRMGHSGRPPQPQPELSWRIPQLRPWRWSGSIHKLASPEALAARGRRQAHRNLFQDVCDRRRLALMSKPFSAPFGLAAGQYVGPRRGKMIFFSRRSTTVRRAQPGTKKASGKEIARVVSHGFHGGAIAIKGGKSCWIGA
jgi:hypothetical protein